MEDEAGIAVIDLDDFKLHNDTYGHSAGDAALITTANIIKKIYPEDGYSDPVWRR